MKSTLIVVTATAAVLALAGCGDTPAPSAAPAPTVTVTTPAKPAPTVTTQVKAVPDVCLDALDAGEKVAKEGGAALRAAGEVIGEVPNLIDAILEMDVDEVERINGVVEENNGKLDADGMTKYVATYNQLAEKCRSTT